MTTLPALRAAAERQARESLVHAKCCGPCPSDANRRAGTVDEESDGYRSLPRLDIAREALFSCAWRTEKVCRGIVDFYGLTEPDLVAAGWRPCPKCGASILDRCLTCDPVRGFPLFREATR